MIDRATDILGLVDVQPTFMPGGELPVPDALAQQVAHILRLAQRAQETRETPTAEIP